MGLPVAVGGKVTAADINDISGLPVANFAALPASGNWLGRLIATSDSGITYRWDGSAWLQPAVGMIPLVPTSATGAGAGTPVSVGANGLITLTAATTLNILGLFSATYRNYFLDCDFVTLGTPGATQTLQLGAGSAVITAYDNQRIYFQDAAAAGPARETNTAQWNLNGNAGPHEMEFRVKGPFLAAPTPILYDIGSFAAAGGVISNVVGRGQHRTAISHTSAHFVFGGTVTGTVRAYGLA